MSDHDDRNHRLEAGPSGDHGVGADPPTDLDTPRTSDDDALADIYDRVGAPIDASGPGHGGD